MSLRTRQLVDWSAAIWAGIISGVVFFLLSLFLSPFIVGGNIWVMVRLFASLTMGEEILAPPGHFSSCRLVSGIRDECFSLFCICLIRRLLHPPRWINHGNPGRNRFRPGDL